MKLKSTILLLAITTHVFAQKMPDACAIITSAQLKALFSYDLVNAASTLDGKRCDFKSEDVNTSVSIEYVPFTDKKTAMTMLQLNYDSYSKEIKDGKYAIAVYRVFGALPDAGKYAYYMTGDGDMYTGLNLLRFQFVLGNYMITFDTKGISKAKVIAKLGEVYKNIKISTGL